MLPGSHIDLQNFIYRDTPNLRKTISQKEIVHITDMGTFYIHQLAGATQITYDQLQHYVRLLDENFSSAGASQSGNGKKIAPTETLFLLLDRHTRAANSRHDWRDFRASSAIWFMPTSWPEVRPDALIRRAEF